MPESSSQRDNHGDLLRYAGLTTQIFLGIGLSLFAGIKADKWLGTSFALFAWALPLLVIVALIVKLIIETSRKRNGQK